MRVRAHIGGGLIGRETWWCRTTGKVTRGRRERDELETSGRRTGLAGEGVTDDMPGERPQGRITRSAVHHARHPVPAGRKGSDLGGSNVLFARGACTTRTHKSGPRPPYIFHRMRRIGMNSCHHSPLLNLSSCPNANIFHSLFSFIPSSQPTSRPTPFASPSLMSPPCRIYHCCAS